MKKFQIIGGLCALSALTSCQNFSPEMTNGEIEQKATLLALEQKRCCVHNNQNNGKFVSYQLHFDTNYDHIADTEMAVCADVSQAKRKDIRSYIKKIKNLPSESRTLEEWQHFVTSHPALGPRTEVGCYHMYQVSQHTK